jgi:hypothetical protein
VEEGSSGRRFLGVWRPPKPVSEMTDEELDAFARAVWEEIVQKMRSEPPVDPHGSSPA